MSKERLIELAKKAGWEYANDDRGFEPLWAFAELVRADAIATEREACAKVCDDFERAKWESVKDITQNGGRLAFAGPMHCAKAIRARSNT